jgi:hypothetical protein
MLLPVLLTEEDGRGELLERLRALKAWRSSAIAAIYESIIAAHEAGDSISFATVHSRISPALQELLTSIVLARDQTHPPTLENALSCLEALRRIEIEPRMRDLKLRIQVAEREGRHQEAFGLTDELNRIVRKPYDRQWGAK